MFRSIAPLAEDLFRLSNWLNVLPKDQVLLGAPPNPNRQVVKTGATNRKNRIGL